MSVEQRRARLVTRHLLDGSAPDPVAVTRGLVCLHATDPSTVYLSVLARSTSTSVADVADAMYERRSLVRMMGMRRTLFVVPDDLAATVHHAAALDVAATVRKRLLQELGTAPTDPPMPADVATWLSEVEDEVEDAIGQLGVASGAQLAAKVPRLRTAILPRTDKAYDVRRSVTSQVLVLMGLQGRLVRGRPLGSWTSRQHTWEPASAWWPHGLAEMSTSEARGRLVAAYLARFGPAQEADVAWWTGWSLRVTRAAVAEAGAVTVDGALVAPADTDSVAVPEPTAALLPALDPTPMGWKQRDWYLPEHPDRTASLFDRSGNIGPTLWWRGEVVGGWAVRKDGTVASRVFVDRGREAAAALEAAAQRLGGRLEGAVVVPSFRTPLERELSRA
jgi:hypothetical protein